MFKFAKKVIVTTLALYGASQLLEQANKKKAQPELGPTSPIESTNVQ